MVDIEALAGRARRAAERSRLRMASRVVWVVLPLACVPLLGGGHAPACACLGLALFAVAAFLRWRDRLGRDAVTTGLVIGSIPVLAALALHACGIECARLWSFGEAEAACLAAGAVAGLGASVLAARAPSARRRRWLTTLVVAAMTSALGCLGLGVAGMLSALVALVASATLVWIPSELRAS